MIDVPQTAVSAAAGLLPAPDQVAGPDPGPRRGAAAAPASLGRFAWRRAGTCVAPTSCPEAAFAAVDTHATYLYVWVVLLGSLSLASVGNVAGVARERGWCRQQVWDCALLGVDAGDGRTSDRSGSRVGLGLVRYCPRRCRSWGWWWGLCWSCSFPLDRRGSVVAVLGTRCGASAVCAVRLLLRVPRGWLCLCARVLC